MNRETTHNDEEENQAVEEFRLFFAEFAERISDNPEFKKHENNLKSFGIRVIEISALLHQDARTQTMH
ncbi:MAG TPA: hypothetical protein VI998_04165 [Patescibacteria group bacterium]|nr:hypothetical protein [Patescibacteria group bacterium]